MMMRLPILFLSLLPSLLLGAERPNVLLISIDDLNDWVGCLGGHPQAKTPHLDALAARGVLFSNAHCQSPVCNPSRASLMTSVYPETSGIYFLNPPVGQSLVAAKALTGSNEVGTDALGNKMGLLPDFGIVHPGAAIAAHRNARHGFDAATNGKI